MFRFQQFITLLIPESLKSNPLLLQKARVLTYIHLLSFLAMLNITILISFGIPISPLSFVIIAYIALLGLIYIFKRNGSLLLSGNLLSGLWILLIAPYVPSTGGLYSDNLLWLVVSPLIALLFGNRFSGLCWMVILEIFLYQLYRNEPLDMAGRIETLRQFDNLYYFTSYTFLSFFVFAVVSISENGQRLTIDLLSAQKAILEHQKQELELQKQEMARQAIELRKYEEKLLASNQELENFAYASSHDLKEPLRMIGMYTQLLKRRLRNKLDDSTEEFMFYITDGVSRMQRLLDDLLAYSRLNKQDTGELKTVDLNDTIFVVVHNLMMAMKETNTVVLLNQLPALNASSTEMTQLFQNLIANAIKFRRKDETPIIQIQYDECANEHCFRLIDNGIGIKKEYQEKVFNLFERLHSRSEYDGSGIGLATCKKIVHKLGGKIWLSSTENVGTIFHFTVPKLIQDKR
jgi:signal transduction histidine kinase